MVIGRVRWCLLGIIVDVLVNWDLVVFGLVVADLLDWFWCCESGRGDYVFAFVKFVVCEGGSGFVRDTRFDEALDGSDRPARLPTGHSGRALDWNLRLRTETRCSTVLRRWVLILEA